MQTIRQEVLQNPDSTLAEAKTSAVSGDAE